MNKKTLINHFKNWLFKNSSDDYMHSPEFANYELNRLLKTEADGKVVFEDKSIFVGVYEYDYLIYKSISSDGREHRFPFNAVGIGIKENVTDNDYELADYDELAFIMR